MVCPAFAGHSLESRLAAQSSVGQALGACDLYGSAQLSRLGTKSAVLVSGVAATLLVACVNVLALYLKPLRTLLLPLYFLASAFGSIHDPSTLVFLGVQWSVAWFCVLIGVTWWQERRSVSG